jgi:hypothetical protein
MEPLERFRALHADPKSCQVNFLVLDARRISERIMRNGFKIFKVAKYDLKIVEKARARPNVIQISFKDLSVMWDLDEDREVSFINKPCDFGSQRTYVPTGFVPHGYKNLKQTMD